MRLLTGLAVGALLLVQASAANAQLSMNAFGGYPAGITTGSPSPYGIYSQGYYTERYGYPFSYNYQVSPIYGTSYTVPGGAGYYSSGYAGYSAPGTYAYGYTYPTNVYTYPAYGPVTTTSYAYPVYTYRRGGLLGGLRNRWR